MAFNREASGDLLQHDKVVNSGLQYGLAAEAHLALATLSAILIDLCESYYAIVDGVGGCLNGLFRVGELDLVVQEALAAYERQVLRRNATFTVDDDDDGDVCDWVSLLSRRVQGRVRHRCGLIADVNITDWQPAAISDDFQGHSRFTTASPVTEKHVIDIQTLSDALFLRDCRRHGGGNAELPEAIKKRKLRLQKEEFQLCDKHIRRDMAKLNELGRRWADYKRSSSLYIGRYFRLQRIVRDAVADYQLFAD